MCWKFDAKHITILSRNPFSPYGQWPENVTFKTAGIADCKVVHDGHDTKESLVLTDGTEMGDIDALLLCTGYQYNFRFIDNAIRLETRHLCVADNLYKGLWLNTDPDIMYLGMQD